jgi:pimeloyl-ACP methyl ester carboxylesterase
MDAEEAMLGRLVDATTNDGIKLHGFLVSPKHATHRLWIIVHGVNGNFYGSTFLSWLAETCLGAGQAALLINTRGHDLASFGSAELPARIGSMFEMIPDAMNDLQAWVEWADREGFVEPGLIAHSLGAVKSLYCLAHGLVGVRRLIALSPPRLNTELLVSDPEKNHVFREHLAQAQALCDSGNEHQIIRVRFPLPNWVSAGTFLDKYGSGEKYDYMYLWGRVTVPCLWLFGSLEVRSGSANFLDADRHLLREWQKSGGSESTHELEVIDGADHSYRNTRGALEKSLLPWIAQ